VALVVWNGGGVAPVAEVKTLTITAVAAGQVVGVVINGKEVSYTATGTDTAVTAATALAAALAASTIPEFAEVGTGWSNADASGNPTATVTGRHQAPGTPWSAAVSGDTTAAVTPAAGSPLATTTAAVGPNFVDQPANWSTGSLPGTGDDVVFERSGVDALYGLTHFAATAFNSLTVRQSFTGAIGLSATNGGSGSTVAPGASGGYTEYRPRYLQLGGNPPVTIGEGGGTGSGRVNLQVGTGGCVVNVLATGNPSDDPGAAVNLLNSGTGNTLNVTSGSVGVAGEGATQSAGFAAVSLSGGAVTIGSGATVGAVSHEGGTLDCAASPGGTLTMARTAGTATYRGPGPLTAAVYGGTLVYLSNGALTLTASGPTAKIDLSQDPRAKTLTNTSTVGGGAVLYDPAATLTAATVTFDDLSLAKAVLGPVAKLVRP